MSNWIPLLVRQEDFAEFAARVAEREVGREDPVVLPSVALASVTSTVGGAKESELLATLETWSVEALRQLAESGGTFATADRWGRAMDVMCRHVGVFLSSAELAEEAEMSINQWRDAPRKLPSHLAKHYEQGIGWPLKGVGGRELKRDDQIYWGITSEQAQRWLQVRAQGKAPRISPMTSGGN